MSKQKKSKPTPEQVANAEQRIRESGFPPQVEKAFLDMAEELARHWASTPPRPKPDPDDPSDVEGRQALQEWLEKYGTAFGRSMWPHDKYQIALLGSLFPVVSGLIKLESVHPTTRTHIVSELSRAIREVDATRYAIEFPNGAGIYVVALKNGTVIDKGMSVGKTKSHHARLAAALTRRLDQSQGGGNKRGSQRATEEYANLAERFYASGFSETRFLDVNPNITPSKLQRALRRQSAQKNLSVNRSRPINRR